VPIFDVRHQERAQRILLRALAGGRVPHAYVFHGPRGVGKRMLAERLAMRLLCPRPVEVAPPEEWRGLPADVPVLDACGDCDDCRAVPAGSHPDLHVIHRGLHAFHPDPEVRRRKGIELGIDVIRHFVIEAAGRQPMRGRAKVFILDEAERLNEESQNAMLKTLEEPPPATFIVLVITSIDRLLPTIRSRCHPVPFRALPIEFVEARLREVRPDLPSDVATYLARLSEGRLGVALDFAEEQVPQMKRTLGEQLAGLAPQTIDETARVLGDLAAQYAKRIRQRDEDLPETEAGRIGIRALLAAAAAFYMDAQRRKVGAATLPINVDQPAVVDALVRRHSTRGLQRAVREIVAAERAVDANVNLQLVLESLATRLAGLS